MILSPPSETACGTLHRCKVSLLRAPLLRDGRAYIHVLVSDSAAPEAWLFIPLREDRSTQITAADFWRRLRGARYVDAWFYEFALGIESPLMMAGENGELLTFSMLADPIDAHEEPDLYKQVTTSLMDAQAEVGSRIVACPAPVIEQSQPRVQTGTATPGPLIEGKLF